MTEEKTIFKISIDNLNQIHTSIDLSSIEDEEDALRFVHSLLDEHKEEVLHLIRKTRTPVEDDEEF
jgi:hypothetical protein